MAELREFEDKIRVSLTEGDDSLMCRLKKCMSSIKEVDARLDDHIEAAKREFALYSKKYNHPISRGHDSNLNTHRSSLKEDPKSKTDEPAGSTKSASIFKKKAGVVDYSSN